MRVLPSLSLTLSFLDNHHTIFPPQSLRRSACVSPSNKGSPVPETLRRSQGAQLERSLSQMEVDWCWGDSLEGAFEANGPENSGHFLWLSKKNVFYSGVWNYPRCGWETSWNLKRHLAYLRAKPQHFVPGPHLSFCSPLRCCCASPPAVTSWDGPSPHFPPAALLLLRGAKPNPLQGTAFLQAFVARRSSQRGPPKTLLSACNPVSLLRDWV